MKIRETISNDLDLYKYYRRRLVKNIEGAPRNIGEELNNIYFFAALLT